MNGPFSRRWLLGLAIVIAFARTSSCAYELDLSAISDSIAAIEADYSQEAPVDHLTLERGGVKFIFRSGTITLARPVLGEVFAAAFVGKGRFEMALPNSAERYMFTRLCKDTAASWEFGELALMATDETLRELKEKLVFSPAAKRSDKPQQLLGDFVNYVEGELDISLASLILPELLQRQLPGSFTARFPSKCGSALFCYDPKEVEEVALWRHVITPQGPYPELASSFHSPEQYADSRWGPSHENKDLIDSLEYEISGKVWQSAKTDLEVRLSFISNVADLQAVTFFIFPDLMKETIRVADEAGDSVFWQKLKEEGRITVYLRQPLKKGERCSLKFDYSSKGMLAKTPWGNNILVSSTTWYPHYGYLKRARFKLTYACPEQYVFLSVGRKVSEKVEDGFRITEWDASDYPLAAISYNYGDFSFDSTRTSDGVPVEVYRSKAHGGASAKMLQNVLSDINGALSLYSIELLPYPFERLLVTEIPSGHGQGMPGLLHLAWSTFQSQTIPYDDAFRAHEVAHQWWGHLVGWESYHDQWLSEGFAEYLGAWYVQRKYLNDQQHRGKFFELMDRWREDVMESGGARGGFYQEGNDAGPIWIGRRLASSKSSDYTTLVYSKGAYILYMLRMMMFDFAKRDDSRFNKMLADFLDQYRWQEATTADFQRVAEDHYGSKLDWFFDEWVYDVQIPTYRWSVTAVQDPDAKYIVTVDVETEGVKDDFRMLVPFTIVMEGDYHTTTRLDIDQVSKRITLPRVPYKPVKFVFNPYRSVLCKDKEAK